MSESSHSDSIRTSESLTEATSNEGSQMSTEETIESEVKWCGPSPNRITISIELICLIFISGWIFAYNEIILPVGSVLIHGIPYVVTYIISYSIADILNAIFNWFISKQILDREINKEKERYQNLMVTAANSQVPGIFTVFQRLTLIRKYCRENNCLDFIIIFGFIAALTTFLSGIIFAISTTPQTPGLMPIYSNSLNIDPLTPCGVGDASCPSLLQDRFRFMWLQGASDVLINGITNQLSVNWGDDPGGKRKIMVAVVDNNTSINYKFVKDNKQSVPVFSLSTIYNISTPPNVPSFRTPYHNLTMTDRINLTLAVEMDLLLENRWIAEVISLQQDDLNETTIMTVNLVKILSLNSKCEGI
ncbi:40632_t:CDS:1, partial [Gigaspora margarita]